MTRSTIETALIEVLRLKPAAWLGILGGALEILGFALVATELVRAQRRELGTAGPFQCILNWASWVRLGWRRLRGKSADTIFHDVGLASTVEMAGRLTVRKSAQHEDLSLRVQVLEENFQRLDKDVADHRKELEDRIGKETKRLDKSVGQLRNEMDARAEEDKKAFADSAKLEWIGIGLFVLGAAVSATANVVGA